MLKNLALAPILFVALAAAPLALSGQIPLALADNGLIFTSSNSTAVSTGPDSTSVSISPSSPTANAGASVTLIVTVEDAQNPSNTPSGSVLLSDNNAGGTFSPSSCTVSGGTCSVSYTASQTSSGTITITASYAGDSGHNPSSGTYSITISPLNPTSTTISPNTGALPANRTMEFSIVVKDTAASPLALSGSVTISDNNAGGTFTPDSCTLTAGQCVTTYVAAVNPPNVIKINATYGGDSQHSGSSAVSSISTSTLDGTVTTLTPNPATYSSGGSVAFTATVSDAANPSSSMIGIISWGDGGAGGIFNPNNCILSNNKCAVTYTPPSQIAGPVTITATYAGDSGHSGSSGTSSLSSGTATSQQSSGPSATSPATTPASPQQNPPSAQQPGTTQTAPSSTQSSPTTSQGTDQPNAPSNPSTQTQSSASPAPNPSAMAGTGQQGQAPPSSPAGTTNNGHANPSVGTAPLEGAGSQNPQVQPSDQGASPAAVPQSSPPSKTQSGISSPANPSQQGTPTVSQIINSPETIFDKFISLFESLFKKF